VEPVGPALGNEVDLAAGAEAELRGVVAGLNLELLDGVHVGTKDQAAAEAVVVGGAVHQKVVVIAAAAVDRQSGTAVAAGVDPRAELGELEEVAPVERQRDDLLGVDHVPHRGALGLKKRRAAGDLDRLRNYADFEANVKPHLLVHLKADPGEGGAAKALLLDANRVRADQQERGRVAALLVGGELAPLAGVLVDDRDTCIGDSSAARIGDESEDGARDGLGARGRGEGQEGE
jgi:hypothetical protein